MDLEECLLSKHNMEVYSVIRNRGNSIQAKYEIGCMPGFTPNMEGRQTTTVACNRQKDDLTKEGFSFRTGIYIQILNQSKFETGNEPKNGPEMKPT